MLDVIPVLIGGGLGGWGAWQALRKLALSRAGGQTPPPVRARAAAIPPTCAIESLDLSNADLRPLDASRLKGGRHIARDANLARGATLTLTRRSLLLIARDDIVIDGSIDIRPTGDTRLDVTLVSLAGSILIGGSGGIYGAAPPRRATRTGRGAGIALSGAHGTSGGNIRLLAPSGLVRIKGTIEAAPGGDGISVDATGTPYLGIPTLAGGANARGGQGGDGGHVLICASELIDIGPSGVLVAAGDGGTGGDADTDACGGGLSRALAGAGGHAGGVWLVGSGNGPCTVQLANTSEIRAGLPGDGAGAIALTGAGGPTASSSAVAEGGVGGEGGSVVFRNCVLAGPPANVFGSEGGYGGPADAVGGAGLPAIIWTGPAGGWGKAAGGDAGTHGAAPVCPLPNGGSATGSLATQPPAGGGNAAALGGAGGAGGGWALATPGKPGRASAQGGAGFRVSTRPTRVTATNGAPVTSAGNP